MNLDLKYRLDGYGRFTDSDGYPAITTPWGTLNAPELNTDEYAWRIFFGSIPALSHRDSPMPAAKTTAAPPTMKTGCFSSAPPTADAKFRAFDKRTGKQL